MKLNIKRPNALAEWSSKVIKLLGLFLVISIVWNVCQSRLNVLKQDRAVNMAGYVSAADRLKQLDCLTRNIYWEAASEPFEGKVAVAQVTLNRVEDGRFANTVCGVVYQKNVFYERVVCQFSVGSAKAITRSEQYTSPCGKKAN
jgi:spore germination cell wall hydrolase CwlJ-like protein